MNVFYVGLSWTSWLLSFVLDPFPDEQEKLRRWETSAVIIFFGVFLLDMVYWGTSFFIGVAHAFVRKERAGDNPWGAGATTLEWTLSSPPPFHQFEKLPLIK